MAGTEHRDQSPLSFPVLPHSRPVPRRRVPGHRREVFASGPVRVFLGYCVATAPVLFIVSLQETPALGSLGTHMRGRVPPWLWGLQPGGVRGEVEHPGFGSTFLWVPFEVIWGACVCVGGSSRGPPLALRPTRVQTIPMEYICIKRYPYTISSLRLRGVWCADGQRPARASFRFSAPHVLASHVGTSALRCRVSRDDDGHVTDWGEGRLRREH